MGTLILAVATASILWGEKIPRNQGFGYEAFGVYKPITQHFPDYLRERRIDSYSIQRILPFGIAHYTLRALGLPLRGPYILRFFEVYNAVLLVLIAGIWTATASAEGVSTKGQWLGFLGLIVNFAALKLNFYYPVSYAMTALLVGVAALYFYRRNSVSGLLVVSLAGLLVWPTTIVFHPLLLLLPATSRLPLHDDGSPARVNRWLIRAAIAALLCVFLWVYFIAKWTSGHVAKPVMPLLPLSLAAVWFYLALGLDRLLGRVDLGPGRVRGDILPPLRGLVAAAVLLASYVVLTRILASDAPSRVSLASLLGNLTFGATSRPLQFAVAHVLEFGPVFLLTVLLWPRVCEHARALGAGVVILLAVVVLQSVDSESQHLINVWPFVVLPTVLAAEERRLGSGFLATMAAFSLVLSKVWLPINYDVGVGAAARSFPTTANFLEFPGQIYFMNFGPWISNTMLLVQGAVVVGMGVCLHRLLVRPTGGSGPSSEESRS